MRNGEVRQTSDEDRGCRGVNIGMEKGEQSRGLEKVREQEAREESKSVSLR